MIMSQHHHIHRAATTTGTLHRIALRQCLRLRRVDESAQHPTTPHRTPGITYLNHNALDSHPPDDPPCPPHARNNTPNTHATDRDIITILVERTQNTADLLQHAPVPILDMPDTASIISPQRVSKPQSRWLKKDTDSDKAANKRDEGAEFGEEIMRWMQEREAEGWEVCVHYLQ